jgi:hypothetical protein
MKKLAVLAGLAIMLSVARVAHADTYQLATGSGVVTAVQVSSFAWTQVDSPQLYGRTSLEIQNVDVSSPVACAFINTGALSGLTTSYRLIPQATAGTSYPAWSLSLSNFASNRGAYPVTVPLPVYCTTGKVGSSANVIVTQTQ